MKYAIIRTGGKQYRCTEGSAIEVDRLPVEAGDTHHFNEVLLLADDGNVTVGAPTIAGGVVTAKVISQIKGPKTLAFRYKAKERQRTRRGHRAQFTRLQIEKIEG
jgi:large subunit ribosomal protein L21